MLGRQLNNNESRADQITFLRRRNKQYLFTICLLAIITVLSVSAVIWICYNDEIRSYFIQMDESPPPYKKAVNDIIRPLKYSNINALSREDLIVVLNFKKKTWRLENLYRFDEEGHILLEKGNTGVCSVLANYVYDEVRPIFSDNDKYDVGLIRVQESEYFPAPFSNHFVVGIQDRSGFFTKKYIIDPSYKKYANLRDFEDYLLIEVMDRPKLLQEMRKGDDHLVGYTIPIMIKKPYIFSLVTDAMGGKYDKNNYAMILSAKKRYRYVTRHVYGIRKLNGEISVMENREAFRGVLTNSEYESLKKLINKLFARARYEDEGPADNKPSPAGSTGQAEIANDVRE